MPDQFGRLSLAEMRTYVLRNLAVYVPGGINQTTGAETGTASLGMNTQFSEDNLNLRINSSTTKVSALINANNDKVFRKEVFFDAVPGVLEYAIPPDCMQISSLWWLDPGVPASTPATPENYSPMSYQETFEDGATVDGVNISRPTWRLIGGAIQLNQDPADWLTATNAQGIWVKYIRRMTYLASDTSYLEPPFANEAQECVVWDATLTLLQTQAETVDSSGVQNQLTYWLSQLELAVRNQYRPPEIRLKGPSMVKNTFSGRSCSVPGGTFEWR